MSSGRKRNRSNVPLKAVMIYLTAEEADKLREYAHGSGLSSSRVAREAIVARLGEQGKPYDQGYNDAIDDCVRAVKDTKGAQMMFPSGKSFAQLVCESIEPFKRRVSNGRE